MPQVASNSTVHALNRLLAPGGQQTHSSDRLPATPFDSLLDSAPPPAPEPPTRRTSNDKPAKADRPDQNQAKPVDKPDQMAKSDGTSKSLDANAAPQPAAKVTKAASGNNSSADVKSAQDSTGDKVTKDIKGVENVKDAKDAKDTTSAEQTAAIGDAIVTPADNAKSADAGKPVDVAATPAIVQTPAITGADVIAVALVPSAPLDTAQPAQSVEPVQPAQSAQSAQSTQPAQSIQSTVAATVTESTAVQNAQPTPPAVPQAKTEQAGKKAIAEKPAVDAKTPAITPAPLDPAASAQTAAGKPDKDAADHFHAELAADAHRGSNPDAAGTAGLDNNKTAAPKTAPDIAQPSVLTAATPTAPVPTSSATPAPAAPAAPPAAAVPLAGVAIEITSKALAGKNHFEIRLDPPELGRIHVHLDVDRDGNVISHMVADRTDTLDLLRRDTAGLERALQDAGLKTSDNSLQFSLSDKSANQQQNNSGTNTAHIVVEDEQLASLDVASRDYTRYGTRAGGLDISV